MSTLKFIILFTLFCQQGQLNAALQTKSEPCDKSQPAEKRSSDWLSRKWLDRQSRRVKAAVWTATVVLSLLLIFAMGVLRHFMKIKKSGQAFGSGPKQSILRASLTKTTEEVLGWFGTLNKNPKKEPTPPRPVLFPQI